MSPKRSYIWDYFTREENDKVKCNLCAAFLSMKSGSSTSNMNRHIKLKHITINLKDSRLENSDADTVYYDDEENEKGVHTNNIEIQEDSPEYKCGLNSKRIEFYYSDQDKSNNIPSSSSGNATSRSKKQYTVGYAQENLPKEEIQENMGNEIYSHKHTNSNMTFAEYVYSRLEDMSVEEAKEKRKAMLLVLEN